MLTVKVLGSGCSNCVQVEDVAKKVVTSLGLQAQVIKVTDHMEIMHYNLLATPGLVVNEKLVSAGRIPTEAEVTTWMMSVMANDLVA
jgi:small redox-active disulfide protein 2